jgi:chromosome partitioning protein
MDSLQGKIPTRNKVFSFYNMVQAHKNLHKHYLEMRQQDTERILYNYIPFYAEIESITLSKESIFHQLKEFKTNVYYDKLWSEVCDRMEWPSLNVSKTVVLDIKADHKKNIQPLEVYVADQLPRTSNG